MYIVWRFVGERITKGRGILGSLANLAGGNRPPGDRTARVPGKPGRIMVERGHHDWLEVNIPEGYTVKDVVAAKIIEGGEGAIIEIKHEVTDRRTARGDSDPPDERLGLR